MPDTYADQKRRPPPITIPSRPAALPRSTQVAAASQTKSSADNGQQQRDIHNESSSTQSGPRSATTPLTSPLDGPSQLQATSKKRATATTTLTGILEQALGSPRRSNYGSTLSSRHGSTTRSRHSARSHQSSAVAKPQAEAGEADERTSRGMIESRTERSLFKMTGHVPPTPIEGRSCVSVSKILTNCSRIPW